MQSSKYYFLISFGLALLIFVSPDLVAHAASLEYASLGNTSSSTQQIVIRFGGLGNKLYYACHLDTLVCDNNGSTTPNVIDDTPVPDPSEFYSVANVPRIARRSASPDGRFVYYYQYSNTTHPVRKFVILDAKTGVQASSSDTNSYWDLLTEENRIFAVSPDSKTLMYLDDRNGSPALYQVDLSNFNKHSLPGQQITKNSYSVSDFYMYDNHTLLFLANRDNPLVWSLYKYDLVTNNLEKVSSNMSYAQQMEKVGDNMILLQMKGNAVVPMIYNPQTESIKYFSLPETSGIENVNNSYQAFHSGILNGVLLMPSLTSNLTLSTTTSLLAHPLIIWLHGGPYRQVSTTIHSYESYGVYDWVLEQARENGAVVLKLDYHGSYGYGRVFGSALKDHAGVTDVNDVMQALASVKRQLQLSYPISNIYLVGNSYGGYLALKTIVDHPNSFSGAFSINGVTDWPTLLTKIHDSIFNIYFEGLPKTSNSTLYANADIAGNVDNLTSNQKIMLVQAQADMTIDPTQADFLYNVLNIQNKNVDILKIPNEDHVFAKPSSISNICTVLMNFTGLSTTPRANCNFQ